VSETENLESKKRVPLGISDLALEEFLKIIKVLRNEDSLNIFLISEKGITGSKEDIRNFGLTQKRFYLRVKELIDVGLIEKKEGKYKLSELGKIIFNTIIKLEPILLLKDKLKVLDHIKELGIISKEKELDFIKMIFPQEVYDFISNDTITSSKMITNFDDLKKVIVSEIENSQKNILFISKYYDPTVTEKCFNKMESGVDFLCVTEPIKLSEAKKFLSILLTPKSVKILYDFLNKYRKNIKIVDKILTSMLIVDDKKAFIEVLNPTSEDFLFAVEINDKTIVISLTEIFFNIWNNGKEFSVI
jgi:predicted transcriptional regulator